MADNSVNIQSGIQSIPSKVPLEQFDLSTLKKERIRELYRAGKIPTPEAILEEVILRAAKEGYRFIHFEPIDNELKIRFGSYDFLKDVVSLPINMADNLAGIIKIKAGINAFEKRKPQHGRYITTIGPLQFSLGVNLIAINAGERITIDLIHKNADIPDLTAIGLHGSNLNKYKELLSRKSGLILAVGAKDSGKSTTLYSTLKYLKSREKNIVTVEERPEYQLNFATQIIIAPEVGLTREEALDALLNQNPNISLISEISDNATLTKALEAVVRGCLVLSTMIARDSISAIPRLLGFGISPYELSTGLSGIVYQAFVRKLCEACKEVYNPDEQQRKLFGNILPDRQQLFRAVGCEQCRGSGYYGRIAAFEILNVNDELLDLIYQNAALSAIRESARRSGFLDIREDIISKILTGITSIDELKRVMN
jgi:type II secretory ATPase GspE/PulE/Tfp pilus assembly ATPase PilB-like protein